jgi:hypothetical protein
VPPDPISVGRVAVRWAPGFWLPDRSGSFGTIGSSDDDDHLARSEAVIRRAAEVLDAEGSLEGPTSPARPVHPDHDYVRTRGTRASTSYTLQLEGCCRLYVVVSTCDDDVMAAEFEIYVLGYYCIDVQAAPHLPAGLIFDVTKDR